MKQMEPKYGVSFSIKCCRGFKLDPKRVLMALLDDLGVRRFRLMSYWDEIEKVSRQYDFNDLDWQFDEIERRGGVVSLAIGLRQPRYPECHAPEWAKGLSDDALRHELLSFVEVVVERYRTRRGLVSWQLENEALNHGIGECRNYDRRRLRDELSLVKRLDNGRPVIMSLSNSYGLPMRRPIPDQFGISLYLRQYSHQKGYCKTKIPTWFIALRCRLIELFWRKPVFIHELQAEPWGPRGNAELSLQEQNKSMDSQKLKEALTAARVVGRFPIDLWGAEWWFWRKDFFRDDSIWLEVQKLFDTAA